MPTVLCYVLCLTFVSGFESHSLRQFYSEGLRADFLAAKLPLPPVRYSVYKRILGRFNDLYSLWQQTITENAELIRENSLLKQQLQTSQYQQARPTRIRP
jgi:hypothetical protein